MKPITDYKNYVFDLDGTLYFHKPVKRYMLRKVVFYFGLRFWKIKQLFIIQQYRKVHDSGDFETCRQIENKHAVLIAKWMLEIPLVAIKRHADRNLCNLIQQQHKHGKTIVVYSDHPTAEKLGALGLTHFVTHQFHPGDGVVQTLKPDPDGLQQIIKTTDIKTADTIFIGDRDSKDGASARAVGMDYIILAKKKSERKYDFMG
jgi:FMN phosphatase YigB (HAD superfamily)